LPRERNFTWPALCPLLASKLRGSTTEIAWTEAFVALLESADSLSPLASPPSCLGRGLLCKAINKTPETPKAIVRVHTRLTQSRKSMLPSSVSRNFPYQTVSTSAALTEARLPAAVRFVAAPLPHLPRCPVAFRPRNP